MEIVRIKNSERKKLENLGNMMQERKIRKGGIFI